ncbi:MAG: D-alanyl-D-alanine carboxypeptidase [Ruminococcaceae bacterium]|nr:D-alanyl-D-alanine carboxypeptidase [Oscillospiraceae bacterium]
MNTNRISFRIVSFFFTLSFFLSAFCQTCFASEDENELPNMKYASDICLYNVNADKIVFQQSENKKIFAACSAKMMTGLIACETLSDRLGERIVITSELLDGTEGFTARLKPGMTVTVEELLLALLCGGGNDAAIVVSKLCSESTEAFVELMNAKCNEWGLRSSSYTNPTGLDDKKMYTSLSDILSLAKLASKNELYVRMSSTPYFSYSDNGGTEVRVNNRNSLINTYYADGYNNKNVKGLITSFTDLGGYSAIVYAEHGDEAYICIVMGAQEHNGTIYSYEYANTLLSYGFDNFKYTKVLESGKDICFADIELASPEDGKETASVPCISAEDAYALIPRDIDVNSDLEYRSYLHYDTLQAPLSKNVVVGGVDVIYNGEVIASSKLVTKEDIQANGLILFLHNARIFLCSRAVIICVCIITISLLIYFYIFLMKTRRKTVKNIEYKNFY